MAVANLLNRVQVNSICSNNDALYGPYDSVEEALETIPSSLLGLDAIGRTIGVKENGKVVEYWLQPNGSSYSFEKKIGASTLGISMPMRGFGNMLQQFSQSTDGEGSADYGNLVPVGVIYNTFNGLAAFVYPHVFNYPWAYETDMFPIYHYRVGKSGYWVFINMKEIGMTNTDSWESAIKQVTEDGYIFYTLTDNNGVGTIYTDKNLKVLKAFWEIAGNGYIETTFTDATIQIKEGQYIILYTIVDDITLLENGEVTKLAMSEYSTVEMFFNYENGVYKNTSNVFSEDFVLKDIQYEKNNDGIITIKYKILEGVDTGKILLVHDILPTYKEIEEDLLYTFYFDASHRGNIRADYQNEIKILTRYSQPTPPYGMFKMLRGNCLITPEVMTS